MCSDSQWSCEVGLTISQSLSIFRQYVMVLYCSVNWPDSSWYLSFILSLYVRVLNDPVKLTWPFPNLCPSSGSMWRSSTILSTWLDHFPISVYLRVYVMVVNDLSSWPDHFLISVHPQLVCDGSQWCCQVDLTIFQSSSVCMWFSMILSSWSEHFPIFVHPQDVCDGSQWSCQVGITISQSLSILRMYVVVLNDPVRFT